MHFNSILSVSLLVTAASAHFTLNFPPAIGFSEDDESTGPCGGFKATDRSKKVTDFPISGSSIAVLTTHPSVQYEFRAALLNDTDNFKSILPGLVAQNGMGDLCEPGVSIPDEWEGEEGVIQVVHRAKGEPFLFQCAAVTFAKASTKDVAGSACKNTSNTEVSFTSGSFSVPSGTETGSAASASSTSGAASGPLMTAGANAIAAAFLILGFFY